MKINKPEEMSNIEAQRYVDYLQDKYGRKVEELTIEADGEYVDLNYEFAKLPFERIRRITGYLSSIDTWNNGKKAELKDRVMHELAERE